MLLPAWRKAIQQDGLRGTSVVKAILSLCTGLAADLVSGLDQLASRAHYNEIDAVIYLRDPLLGEYDRPNSLMKACDTNSIPIATNIATAELLVLAIDRGDLDWRELVR